MSEYKIDLQDWKSWPKAVMVRRDWTTNGHDHRREVRRYVPDEIARDRDVLKDENAKLRELLLDVWNDAIEFDGFWDYVMDDGEIYSQDELPHYQERMRELGIEVE